MVETDRLAMNDGLLEKWFKKRTELTPDQYSIFMNILNITRADLTIFYKMNEVLDGKEQIYKYINGNYRVVFTKEEDRYLLLSDFGNIAMTLEVAKKLFATIVDLYTETLPLGTVVEMTEEFTRNIVNDVEGNMNLVIVDRLMPDEGRFFLYSGTVYPMGNIGEEVDMLLFSQSDIKRVIHMGYTDEEDYIYENKLRLSYLFGLGINSTSISSIQKKELQENK